MKLYKITRNATFNHLSPFDIVLGCKLAATHEEIRILRWYLFMCKKGIVFECAYDWELEEL